MWKTMLTAAVAATLLAACGENAKAKATAPAVQAAPAAQSAPAAPAQSAPAAEERKEGSAPKPEGEKPEGEKKDQ